MPEPIIAVEGLFKTYNPTASPSRPCAASASRSRKVRCSACSVRTAPEKPPPSKFWKACARPTAALRASAAWILKRPAPSSSRGSARFCSPPPCPINFASRKRSTYSRTSTHNRADTESLLKRFQLEEKRNAFYSQLSGGQKQRLALAMALVNDPQVVFLDEPTAGLDPQVRREIYDIIEELRKDKKTVLITTHYIEEAERLCDRVAIVDYGRIIKTGTPRELKHASAGTTRIEVRLARPLTDGSARHSGRRRRLPRIRRNLRHAFHAAAADHRRAGKTARSGK